MSEMSLQLQDSEKVLFMNMTEQFLDSQPQVDKIKNISSKLPHFIFSLIFPQIFFISFLIMVLRLWLKPLWQSPMLVSMLLVQIYLWVSNCVFYFVLVKWDKSSASAFKFWSIRLMCGPHPVDKHQRGGWRGSWQLAQIYSINLTLRVSRFNWQNANTGIIITKESQTGVCLYECLLFYWMRAPYLIFKNDIWYLLIIFTYKMPGENDQWLSLKVKESCKSW